MLLGPFTLIVTLSSSLIECNGLGLILHSFVPVSALSESAFASGPEIGRLVGNGTASFVVRGRSEGGEERVRF